MSRKINSSSLWLVGLLILAAAANQAIAIGCSSAMTLLIPCLPYFQGQGSVTAPCCEGASKLNQIAKLNRGEWKSLCKCIQHAAANFKFKADRAEQIPQLCHIDVPVPIDPKVDCNSL